MTFWNSPRYYLNCTVQSWSCNRFSLAVCWLLFLYNDFSNGPMESESSQQFGLMSSDPSFPTANINSSNKFTFTFHYYLEITLKTCLGILRIEFTILFSRFSRTCAAAEEYGKNTRCLLTSLAWLVPYPSSLTSAVNRIYSRRHFQRRRFWKKKEHVKPFDILNVPRHLPLPKASEISSKLNQGHPTTIFVKISVRKTISDLEFSEHLL